MNEKAEIKFYLWDHVIAICSPDKRGKKSYKICHPFDIAILGIDDKVWIFLEDHTRDSEI